MRDTAIRVVGMDNTVGRSHIECTRGDDYSGVYILKKNLLPALFKGEHSWQNVKYKIKRQTITVDYKMDTTVKKYQTM